MQGEEIAYLRGLCFLDSGESIKSAIESFKNCSTKPDALIMLAVCEKKSGNRNAAV
jgi:hypothetical protein